MTWHEMTPTGPMMACDSGKGAGRPTLNLSVIVPVNGYGFRNGIQPSCRNAANE